MKGVTDLGHKYAHARIHMSVRTAVYVLHTHECTYCMASISWPCREAGREAVEAGGGRTWSCSRGTCLGEGEWCEGAGFAPTPAMLSGIVWELLAAFVSTSAA
jgi:hypothetical protein